MAVDTAQEAAAEIEEPRRRRVDLGVVVALVIATGFATWAVTQWWTSREDKPNAAAVGFYDDMTTHHYQAVEMSNIYIRNGDDPLLREIAAKISFAQAGDIRVMQRALVDWNQDGTPDVAMEWMGMPVDQNAQPGMATADQMAALEAARGSELDDQFSELMIRHHAAGIHMAEQAAERANLGSVRDFASIVAGAQREEITELNQRRAALGLPEVDADAH